MTLQKAYFENLELKDASVQERMIIAQFNPTDLTFTKTAQLAEIAVPGLDSPVIQFIRGGAETLAVELFFDTTDSGMGDEAKSVTDLTDKFYQLVKQDPKTHAPPRCRFSWGARSATGGAQPAVPPVNPSATAAPVIPEARSAWERDTEVSNAPFWFTCVVESVERKFLLFSPQGIPLRARLTVKMREYKTVEQMAAHLQSADHTKARVLRRRERLDQIAFNEYQTPSEWRRIADENRIEDPRRVRPGTVLRVPALRVQSAIRRPR